MPNGADRQRIFSEQVAPAKLRCLNTTSLRKRPAVVFWMRHAGLAVARALGRAGVPVSGITVDAEHFGMHSRYLRRRLVIRARGSEQRDERTLAALSNLAADERLILFPQYDREVEFVLRHWSSVLDVADVPLPPNPEAAHRLRRKDLLPAQAAKAAIPAPRTARGESAETIRGAPLQPPLVVKPVTGDFASIFGEKAVGAASVEEALQICRKAREHGYPTIVQELVPDAHDRIFSLFTYVGREGEPLASVVGRKVRQEPSRFGTSTVFQVTYEPRVLELGFRLLRSAGYRGLAHVEFAHDRRDDSFKLLEVNTRLPIWAGIAMRGDFDLARVAYDDLCGRPPQPPRILTEEASWIYLAKDLAASLQLARRRELRPRDLISPYLRRRKVRSVFAADDPWPAAASLSYLRSRLAARVGLS